MRTFAEIRGQERVIDLLRRAAASDRVPNAYLFCGPAGVGKLTTAFALALALECIESPGEGCGRCGPCEKVMAGIHPDVRLLERKGAAQIVPIETIRTEVIARMGTQPHEGKVRVFLLEEARALPDASANALLKTLEEPPARTHFILCTSAPDQLLPTIRSRCQRVNFANLGADVRLELGGDEDGAQRTAELAAMLQRAADERDPASLYEVAAEANGERAELLATLVRLTEDLHLAARAAAIAGDLDRAVQLSEQTAVVLRSQEAVLQNAHGLLLLESMLHEMRAVLA